MFVAYAKQSGEGCDYTIGCGQTLWRLKSENTQDALLELDSTMSDEDGFLMRDERGNPFYEEILLFEVKEENKLNLEEWYLADDNARKEYESIQAVKAEKAEYERLKAKFE